MITTVLIDLYNREIDRLKNEIASFESDDQLWKSSETAVPPPGNLCLVVTGTLQHYIGNMIGDTGYIRNREAEMRARNLSRDRVMEEVENMRQTVIDTLEQVSKSELLKVFPTNEFEEAVTTEFYLLHLLRTLAFYSGQISVLRALAAEKVTS